MDCGSTEGRLDILDWWKGSGLTLNHSANAMDGATWAGRLDVLDWWKGVGLVEVQKIDHVTLVGRWFKKSWPEREV